MEKLSSILKNIWNTPAWEKALKAGEILEKWSEIIGTPIARAVRPIGFARGVLTLEVCDHIWLQRLRFEEKKILALLNDARGELLFERLRLVLRRNPPKRPSASRVLKSVPDELKKRYQRELAILEDDDLREAFLKLRLTLARKRLRTLK